MPCSLSFAKPAPERSGAGVLLSIRRTATTGIEPRNSLSYGHFLGKAAEKPRSSGRQHRFMLFALHA